MIETGNPVTFFDAWKRAYETGILMDFRRSVRNPWNVAIVRLRDGTEVEVHPDRIEAVQCGHQ